MNGAFRNRDESAPIMKIDDLLLLADVHGAGSLSAGARALALPKATVSRRLAALEASVGTRLFVPGARRLKLTEFGAGLAERARRHRDEIDDTRQWIGSHDSTPRGRLRLAMPAELGMFLLADSLTRFVQRYPQVELDIDTTPRLVDLNNEPYDLALRVGPLEDSNLMARRLMVLERGLYASPAYLAGLPEPRTPAALRGHRFVMLAQTLLFPQRLQRASRVAELSLTGAIQCNSIGLALALTRAGGGLGMFSHGMVRQDVASGALLPVLPGWNLEPLPVSVVTASRRLMPAKTRAFIDHLFETRPEWASTGSA
jgi:DNA-binding transcriptional LysR family regulator